MIRSLKTAAPSVDTTERDRDVRAIVTAILEDVGKRGDAAVHELSRRFDNYDRKDFRLSTVEIEASLALVGNDPLDDIRFAQAQVRRFAEVQRSTITDVETETLPGVVLGHKNIPVNAVGCYVLGGKVCAPRLGPHVGDHRTRRQDSSRHHRRPALPRAAGARHRRRAAPCRGRRDLLPRRRAVRHGPAGPG